ncbi:YhcN/YlaJ family sporulation lipoprotein [Paenibacillus dokdonensis]|uniref:YhcN/YlaJ family sporulation lipoprotein n=1 Tax=Paenibacillus dokdonensis TaxID=2567944 RepID=UPI0010A8C6D0|nr:YhcN/YlaJ family sporulation lipoprotein [Paenibacillus dokdonensis]
MMRSKAISLSISAALLVSVAGVAGCTTKEPANTNVRTKNVHDARGLNGMNGRLNVNSLRDGNRLSTYSTDGARHNTSNLTSSQELADKVAALKEVRTANVLHTGNSAYVAVTLEDGTKGHMGTKGITGNYGMKSTNSNFRSSSFGTMNNSSFNNNSVGSGTTSANNRGLYGTMGTGSYGIMRGVTGNGTGTGTGTDMGTGTSRLHNYTTSSGEPITKSNGFNATTSGTSGTNETLSENKDNVSAEIKTKISDVIKKADPSITNVYVSANPDFVQRVSNYATEVKNGHPIQGMVSELSTMFERIFPMHTGTDHNINTNTNTNRVTPMGNTPSAPLGKTPAGRHMMQ